MFVFTKYTKMKLLIILCLIFFGRAEDRSHLIDIFSNPRTVQSDTESHLCLRNCTYEKGFNSTEVISVRQKLNANLNPVDIFKNILDQEIIGNVCIAYNRTTDCWSQCPDNEDHELQDVIMPILSSVHYMCSEPKFFDAIPCYKEVYEEMHDICNGPLNCGPKLTAVFESHANNSMVCEYFICVNKCREKKILDNCGVEQRNILFAIHRKIIVSFEKINRKTNQHENFLPSICDKIGQIEN